MATSAAAPASTYRPDSHDLQAIARLRKQCERRLAALDRERSSWFSHWQELSKFILPRRGRFLVAPNQSDRGAKLNNAILDETGTLAARTFAAGMMSGITSPARPWFRFTLGNRDPRSESQAVKAWLDDVRQVTLDAFARSNAYNALGSVYEELGVFGTGVMLIDEDDEDDIRCYTLTVGEYYLGSSARLAIDTIYRVFPMTVGQIVGRFGLECCSDDVQAAYTRGDLDLERDIAHAIEPNDGRIAQSALSEDKPFRSVYWEKGAGTCERLLQYRGYDAFPAMCPRWTTVGNDAYGRGPGMDGLPAVRSAQLLARRHAELVDKTSRPPMQAPIALKNEPMSALPGGVTFLPTNSGDVFKPAFLIAPGAITAVREALQEIRRTISRAFYEDLFLMLSQMDGIQPRQNLEVIERREEKMLMLGPALERLHDELLDRCLKRVVALLRLRNRLPPPPPELMHGAELQIEYISVLAQAQKSVGLTSIERLVAFVGGQAAVKPDVLDKIDQDKAIEVYGDMLNVPPDVIVATDKVQAIRQQRAQQAAAQKAMELAPTAVQGAKVLSNTEVGGGQNALARMMGVG